MKLSDISNTNITPIRQTNNKHFNKKSLLIALIVILSIILVMFIIYSIYCCYMLNKYTKPISSNTKLTISSLVADNENDNTKSYIEKQETDNNAVGSKPDRTYHYYATTATSALFNTPHAELLSLQSTDSLDMDDPDEKDLINVNYSLDFSGKTTYNVELSRQKIIYDGEYTRNYYVSAVNVTVTSDLDYIKGYGSVGEDPGTKMSDTEVKKYYESHKDEVRDRFNQMKEYFGEELFK